MEFHLDADSKSLNGWERRR